MVLSELPVKAFPLQRHASILIIRIPNKILQVNEHIRVVDNIDQQQLLSFSPLLGSSLNFIIMESRICTRLCYWSRLSTIRSISCQKAGLTASIDKELVSTYGIPNSLALALASSLPTSRWDQRSFLLPTSISCAPSSPFSLSSSIQYCMLRKEARSVISKTSSTPSTLRQQMGVIVRKRQVPAVSHSCTFINLPPSQITFCLYSTPIVGVTRYVDSPMQRRNRLVLPTALSPKRRILQRSPSRMAIIYQSPIPTPQSTSPLSSDSHHS